MNTFYAAPWDTGLLTTTILASVICAGTGIFLTLYGRRIKRISLLGGWACQSVGILEIGVLIAFALFTVRGYTVTPDKIQVHRLLWTTDFPLNGLQSVEVEPHAMRGSTRTAGNGGFFAYSGQWRNSLLGEFRVLATAKQATVVLRYETETVVLSPAVPAEFVQEVSGTLTSFVQLPFK